MGRRIRTDVPMVKKLLIPKWPQIKSFEEADKKQKERQKRDFDKRHRTRSLPSLPDDTHVWVDTPRGQAAKRIIRWKYLQDLFAEIVETYEYMELFSNHQLAPKIELLVRHYLKMGLPLVPETIMDSELKGGDEM